tara:strand:+ start:202 stop:441 length:240 start_codon:yes stop_codon:yes gene_type:complete
MKTLWDKLKPEYKKTIILHQEKYVHGPQNTEKALKSVGLFGELTIEELRNLFTWTDICISDIEWSDLFGERFLIKEKNK